MPLQQDFEQAWSQKLLENLDQVVGPEVRREVMAGSQELSSQSSRQAVIDWTRGAMERIDRLMDARTAQEVMTGCACQYPREALQPLRVKYAETGDIDLVHRMLAAAFESFLRGTMGLGEEMVQEIVGRGWGLAGVRKGDTILATKIPKSGSLVEYMAETDPERKRRLYCHCPRVRDAIQNAQPISTTYCYCGAGYYRAIWQEILQQPVRVELLESVLGGGQVCRIAIHLPLP